MPAQQVTDLNAAAAALNSSLPTVPSIPTIPPLLTSDPITSKILSNSKVASSLSGLVSNNASKANTNMASISNIANGYVDVPGSPPSIFTLPDALSAMGTITTLSAGTFAALPSAQNAANSITNIMGGNISSISGSGSMSANAASASSGIVGALSGLKSTLSLTNMLPESLAGPLGGAIGSFSDIGGVSIGTSGVLKSVGSINGSISALSKNPLRSIGDAKLSMSSILSMSSSAENGLSSVINASGSMSSLLNTVEGPLGAISSSITGSAFGKSIGDALSSTGSVISGSSLGKYIGDSAVGKSIGSMLGGKAGGSINSSINAALGDIGNSKLSKKLKGTYSAISSNTDPIKSISSNLSKSANILLNKTEAELYGETLGVGKGQFVNYINKNMFLSESQEQPDINGYTFILLLPPDLSGIVSKDVQNKIDEICKKSLFLAIDATPPSVSINTEQLNTQASVSMPYATTKVATGNLTITFMDNSAMDINSMHNVWIEYIYNQLWGDLKPHIDYITPTNPKFGQMDYATSAFIIKYDPSFSDPPVMVGKATGIFPTSLPVKETIGTRSNRELVMQTITYTCAYYEVVHPKSMVQIYSTNGNDKGTILDEMLEFAKIFKT